MGGKSYNVRKWKQADQSFLPCTTRKDNFRFESIYFSVILQTKQDQVYFTIPDRKQSSLFTQLAQSFICQFQLTGMSKQTRDKNKNSSVSHAPQSFFKLIPY